DVVIANGTPAHAGTSFSLAAIGTISAGNSAATAITSAVISLISSAGNIGASGTPLIVSGGNSGNAQLTLTANATATTSGNGNVYIADSDSDVSGSQPALILGASAAGSGTAVDNTTGNFEVSTGNGGIQVAGAITATTDVKLQAQTNILAGAGGSVAGPQFD